MREIKFRGFDKRDKKIKCISDINFDGQGKVYSVRFAFEDEYTLIDDVELMQYIGLKDKNGVELYEGDICEYHNGRGVYVGVVKYIREYSAYRLVFNDGTWTDLAFVEVIGNIFENPELLEQGNEN